MQNNPGYTITHNAGRTFVQMPLYADPNAVNNALSAMLSGEGFSLTHYKESGRDELVWKKGTGFATAMKFIKLEYQPNMLIISGWICPGMFTLTICEVSLKSGLYAAIPKKSCMKVVQKAIQVVQGFTPPQNFAPQQPQNFAPQQPQNFAPQLPQNFAPQQPQNAAPQQNDSPEQQ